MKKKLAKEYTIDRKNNKKCNCRQTSECPLKGNCATSTVVYQATVKKNSETKTYVGSTEGIFKKKILKPLSRFQQHTPKKFNNTGRLYLDTKTEG